jgi:ribosomal protein L7/L12
MVDLNRDLFFSSTINQNHAIIELDLHLKFKNINYTNIMQTLTVHDVKEKLKNLDDNHPVTLIINGIEHPLVKILFHTESVLMVSESNEHISVVNPKTVNMDDRIKELGHNHKIKAIKEYREATHCGLLEAKLYVEKILDGIPI